MGYSAAVLHQVGHSVSGRVTPRLPGDVFSAIRKAGLCTVPTYTQGASEQDTVSSDPSM